MKTQTIVAVCVCFLSSSLVASESTRKRRRRQRLLRVPSQDTSREAVSESEFLAKDSDFSSQHKSVELESEMDGIDKRLLEELSMSMSMDLRKRQLSLEEDAIDAMIRELETTVSMSMSV